MKKTSIYLIVIFILICVGVVLFIKTTSTVKSALEEKDVISRDVKKTVRRGSAVAGRGEYYGQDKIKPTEFVKDSADSNIQKTVLEEEKRVDEFDSLTDKWMKPSKKGVSLEEVGTFVSAFRRVPASRRKECLQRALNLIHDDNAMLLVGVLTDKTFGKELLTMVFHDVLNRDESVKKPVMLQIFKDKGHPCWADVAWILDVTGELPKTGSKTE